MSELSIEEKKARVKRLALQGACRTTGVNDLVMRLKAAALVSDAEAEMIGWAMLCGFAAIDKHYAKLRIDRDAVARSLDECGSRFLRATTKAGHAMMLGPPPGFEMKDIPDDWRP